MNQLTAALFTGGRSSRMGADKAFLDLDGVPAWRRQLDKLLALSPLQTLISANPEQDFRGSAPAEVVCDAVPWRGPLGGLAACLGVSAGSHVLVLGVDLLAMPADFLQRMWEAVFLSSGIVYRAGAGYEPLAAIYPVTLKPLAEACLAEERLSMQAFVDVAVADGALQPLAMPRDAAKYFLNVNTVADADRWQSTAGDSRDSREAEQVSALGVTTASIRLIRCARDGETGETSAASPETSDWVAAEAPLEIRVEGKSVAVAMRTPGHDEELALGFLISEGVLVRPDDLFDVSRCPSQAADGGEAVDILLTNPEAAALETLTRHVFTSSSCGICGKATIESVFGHFPKVTRPLAFERELVFSLPERLRRAQETFEVTGGLHASAVFARSGDLLWLREDVGRHNALDKVLGAAFLERRLPLNDHILLLSGRVSFELMQKALAAGIPLVAAISAPSSLAIEFAEESGQTLCGFLRDGRMNIYTHPDRLPA